MVINYYMKRLVAFGCSSTTGQGLPDTWVDNIVDSSLISKYSWANVLANMYNVPASIVATPAASNKKITHSVFTFNFLPEDKVFILWSIPGRTCILRDPKSKIRDITITPPDEKYTDYYLKYYDEYDDKFMDIWYKKSVSLYLKSLNIPFQFLYFSLKHNTIEYTLDFCWEDYYNEKNICEDGVHANESAHKKFAERIYECLKE